MCYTGKCKYENYMGDCEVRSWNAKKGYPLNNCPEDAGCVIAEMNIEKMEEAREEA